MMDDFIQVQKEELDRFIKTYSPKLKSSVVRIVEPNTISFDDYSEGKEFPENMMAKIICEWKGEDGEIDREDNHRFWEYYIRRQP